MLFFIGSGDHLFSRAVSHQVSSAAYVLTIVFGMGTGVSHKRIATGSFLFCISKHSKLNNLITYSLFPFSLERRWSSRTFRYGYLVTTSPQLLASPSTAPPLRLGHRLRVLPTPMVWRAVCTRPGNVFTATFWFAITSDFTFDCSSLTVRSQASGASNSHGVTGGVYKARERIHRDILIRDY